jgi:AraC-like DNA-binding protein
MPSSAVRSFTEPDEYAASIRGATAQLTVTGRGIFDAKLIRVELHCLWMQRLSDNLPRVAHTTAMAGRAYISFRTESGPSLLWRGLEMQPTGLIRHGEAPDYYQRSSGDACIGAMSLPVAEIASVGAALAGRDLTPPRDGLILTPPLLAMARLQRLHAAAGRLAERAPEIVADAEAARGMEQSLIQAMVNCLDTGDRRDDTAARRRHHAIMRRFRTVLEATPEPAPYLSDICTTVGVTERALQRCCHEQLGIGPGRFLLLRRMHLARRRLREADAAATNVTKVATQLGFWELGRFAVAYKSLFGESPSRTLRRPPDDRPMADPSLILAEIA